MADLKYRVTLEDLATAVMGKIKAGLSGMVSGVAGLGGRLMSGIGGMFRMLTSLPSLIAGSAVMGALGKAVQALGEQQQADVALAGALRGLGDTSAATLQELQKFASGLQEITTYGDDAIQTAMALGLNLGVPKDRIKEVTEAAIGLAERTGMELPAAMRLFGKTAAGASSDLARYGIVMEEGLSQQERMNRLVKIGAQGFDTQKEKAGTLAGRIAQLKNAVGELWERLGTAVVSLFDVGGGLASLKDRINGITTEKLSAGLAKVAAVARAVWSGVRALWSGLVALGQSAPVQGLLDGLQAVWGVIQALASGTTTFGAVLADLGKIVGASLKLGFMGAINFLASGLQAVVTGATTLLGGIPRLLIEEFKTITKPEFWNGLGQIIMGSLTAVGGFLLKIFTEPLVLLQAGMDTIMKGFMNWLAGLGGGRVGKYLGIAEQENDYGKNLDAARKESRWANQGADAMGLGAAMVKDGAAAVADATKGYRDVLKDQYGEAGRAMAESFANSKDVLDMTGASKDLSDAMAKFGRFKGIDFSPQPPLASPMPVAEERRRTSEGIRTFAGGPSIAADKMLGGGNIKKLSGGLGDDIKSMAGGLGDGRRFGSVNGNRGGTGDSMSVSERFSWMRGAGGSSTKGLSDVAANTSRTNKLLEKIAISEGVK